MDDYQEPSWDLYRTALAVLETGSLSAAARSLGLTQPTVGRQIEALEQQLGLTLFIRSQLGLSPTDAAQAIRPYAQALRATTAALGRAANAAANEVSGTVRITAADMIGVEVLPPILASLRQTHPQLTLELVLSDQTQNLLQRDADIAVRMVQPDQAALVARKVGMISIGFHAHRDYLARHGTPQSLAELANHSLIGYDQETPYIRALRDKIGPLHRGMFALRTDSTLAQFAALRAGLGIGFCQHRLAPRYPELVAVLAETVKVEFETWIVMHEDLRASRRYRVVFDALVAGLAAHIGV